MKTEILKELDKENINWENIILLAKKASLDQLPCDDFGFKKDVINLVKVLTYRDSGIVNCLGLVVNDYHFIDAVEEFVEGKVNILYSDRDTAKNICIRNNIPYNKIRITSNDSKLKGGKYVFSFYKGEDRKKYLSIEDSDLKSYVRDNKLKNILS